MTRKKQPTEPILFSFPQKVTVMGRELNIIVKDLGDGVYGETSVDQSAIYLSNKIDLNDRPFVLRCLAHELTHAMIRIAGLDELIDIKSEEAICVCTENFAPFLKITGVN